MTDWRERGLCGRLDPADVERVMHGAPTKQGGKRHARADLAEARALCDGCPVQFECLRDALAVPWTYDKFGGVRAGLLPAERATLRDRETEAPDAAQWTGAMPGERIGKRQRADGVLLH